MHIIYITTLSINHSNNITTIMHKESTTQDIRGSPQCGATSTNSSYSFIVFCQSYYMHRATNPLRIGQEICIHLTRSSFPELGPSTKPSYNMHTSFLQSLSLSSVSSQYTVCTKHPQLFALSSPTSSYIA
jgi:hypothetical protein